MRITNYRVSNRGEKTLFEVTLFRRKASGFNFSNNKTLGSGG